MAELTQNEILLGDALQKIWDDWEFIVGVLCDLKNEQERVEILDFIRNNSDVTPDDIMVMSLDMALKHEPQPLNKDKFNLMRTRWCRE